MINPMKKCSNKNAKHFPVIFSEFKIQEPRKDLESRSRRIHNNQNRAHPFLPVNSKSCGCKIKPRKPRTRQLFSITIREFSKNIVT
jgi:hypothetical protein